MNKTLTEMYLIGSIWRYYNDEIFLIYELEAIKDETQCYDNDILFYAINHLGQVSGFTKHGAENLKRLV